MIQTQDLVLITLKTINLKSSLKLNWGLKREAANQIKLQGNLVPAPIIHCYKNQLHSIQWDKN